jgi:hypothetical protein
MSGTRVLVSEVAAHPACLAPWISSVVKAIILISPTIPTPLSFEAIYNVAEK